MDYSLKKKAINGMLWTGAERFGAQLIQFIISIVIARVLLPHDYGIIGMLAIFMGVAQTFIDSGFANALIQKKDRNEQDYSTVFYFSIVVGILIYLLLFFSAPLIAKFYSQPILVPVTRVYMLILVFNGVSISQTAKLTVELNFRTQAIISIVSVTVSGTIGIILAYNSYGVWALVWQGISMSIIRSISIWIASKWLPLLSFSKKSFHRLFSFGGKLLASSMINTVYSNISTLIIGRVYQATELGVFTRAQQFCLLPTQTITNIVIKVNYPILSSVQDDNEKLVESYKTLLRTPVFLLFPILFGLAVLAKPLVVVLLGNNWLPSATLIPILCFGFLWEPLTNINLNLLYVKGRTDLVLKLELIKKPIAFIMLVAAIPFGLEIMCAALALYDFVAFVFNCYYTGKILNFGLIKQVRSLLPIFSYSIFMSLIVLSVYLIFNNSLLQLVVGILLGLISYIGIAFLYKDRSLNQILQIVHIKR